MRQIALLAVAVAALAGQGVAQATGAGAVDSVLRRAQQVANDGNPAAGRALADSVLAAAREGSPQFVEALYARAAMAESPEQARRDYLRIAVEFSLSPRAEDALLRLAQLEFARGDRGAARRHLDQLALEHANGPTRAQGLFWMGRVLLEEGTLPQACASLSEARVRASIREVELTNQIGYYARPCAAVQHAADSSRADSVARLDSLARLDSITRADAALGKARPGVTAGAPTKPPNRPGQARGKGFTGPEWTVQVAAYTQKEDAERLMNRLAARGYEARVTFERPYRVRIGRFARRDDAMQLAQKLKVAQTAAIVVEAEKP